MGTKLLAWLDARAPCRHLFGLPTLEETDGHGVRTDLDRVFREAGMP